VPQVLRVALVDVRGLAVGDQQDQLALRRLLRQVPAAWRSAAPMRVDRPPFMPARRDLGASS